MHLSIQSLAFLHHIISTSIHLISWVIHLFESLLNQSDCLITRLRKVLIAQRKETIEE